MLRADLHTHSSISDGRDSPETLVVEAQRRGLDVVAVTDHDTFEGGLRAWRFQRSTGIEVAVIVGAEVRSDRGDILVLCGDRSLQRIPRRLDELVDYARGEGCLVIPAHPFDRRRHGISNAVYDYRWDAIEVFNAMSDPFANKRAEQVAKELGLPGVASSDAHVVEALGAAYTLIDAEPDTDDIMEAIRRGRVKPVPGRPSVNALLRTAAWSVERRLSLLDRRRMEKLRRLSDLDATYWLE